MDLNEIMDRGYGILDKIEASNLSYKKNDETLYVEFNYFISACERALREIEYFYEAEDRYLKDRVVLETDVNRVMDSIKNADVRRNLVLKMLRDLDIDNSLYSEIESLNKDYNKVIDNELFDLEEDLRRILRKSRAIRKNSKSDI